MTPDERDARAGPPPPDEPDDPAGSNWPPPDEPEAPGASSRPAGPEEQTGPAPSPPDPPDPFEPAQPAPQPPADDMPTMAYRPSDDEQPPPADPDPTPVMDPLTDAPELPPLEEITFEVHAEAETVSLPARATGVDPEVPPAPDAAPPPVVSVPSPQRPARAPHIPKNLSRRRFATLAAVAEALIPTGSTTGVGAADADVAARADRAVGAFDERARRRVRRALGLLEYLTIASRAARPFSRLHGEAASAAFARALESRIPPLRAAATLLKTVCVGTWASTPAVETAVGFTYACIGEGSLPESPSLEVAGYPQVTRDHREECDVVVVGSGAGGAVVAKELAETGLSVVVLEAGPARSRAGTGAPFDRFTRLYASHGTMSSAGVPPIPVRTAAGVGGTTLVSAGTALRAPDRVLRRWESEYGIPAIGPDAMRVFYERVERIQRVKPVSEDVAGGNARALARGASRLSLHAAPLTRAVEGCRGCGTCTVGCPTDAILGTHLSYLPRAQRHGATVYAGARAEHIVVEEGRARGVVAAIVDPESGEGKATLMVRAKVVVIAAGALRTPALLSANALGNRSGQLGRNLRLHPGATVSGFFEQPVHGWRGVQQAVVVDDFHDSHDVLIESTALLPGVGAWHLPGAGRAFEDALARIAHVAGATVYVTDSSTGRVVSRGLDREPIVRYALGAHDTRRIVRGIALTAEMLLAAGARAVATGLLGSEPITSKAQLESIDEGRVKPSRLALESWHPSGTARMGIDPTVAVVDPWGEVHGVGGLFVADASVFPGSAAVNPALTVMALATRTADHVVRNGGRYF